MRTTIDIPDDLLAEARTLLRPKTKRDLIIKALQEAVRREKLERFLALAGKVDIKEVDRDFTRGRPGSATDAWRINESKARRRG